MQPDILFSSHNVKLFLQRYCCTGVDVATDEIVIRPRSAYAVRDQSTSTPTLTRIIRNVVDAFSRYGTAIKPNPNLSWIEFQHKWTHRSMQVEIMRRYIPMFIRCFVPLHCRTTNQYETALERMNAQYVDMFFPMNRDRDMVLSYYRKMILIAPRQVGKSVGTAIVIICALAMAARTPVGLDGTDKMMPCTYLTKDSGGCANMSKYMKTVLGIDGFCSNLGITNVRILSGSGDRLVCFTNAAGIDVSISLQLHNSNLVGKNPAIIIHDECLQELTTHTKQLGESTDVGLQAFVKSIEPILQGRQGRLYIATTSVTSTSNPLYHKFLSDETMVSAIITVICNECMSNGRSCICIHNIYRYGVELTLYECIVRSIACIRANNEIARRNFIQEQLGIPQLGCDVVVTEQALQYCLSPDSIIIPSRSRVLQIVVGIDPGHSSSVTAVTILFVLCAVVKYGQLPLTLRSMAVSCENRVPIDVRYEALPTFDDDETVSVRYTHIGNQFMYFCIFKN